jgi:YwiC-like protein
VQQTAPATRSTRAAPAARRPPFVPKEHGASFMSAHALLLGLVASVATGHVDGAGALLAVALTALFLPLSGAVSVASHPAMRAAARRRALALGALELALGILALLHGPVAPLLWLGVAAAVLGGGYAFARSRFGARGVLTQLFAIAGISLLAPATWLLGAGDRGPWALSAAAAFLSFGGTVPYVRERVRRRRTPDRPLAERIRGGSVALGWQAAALAVAVLAWATGVASWLLPVAFVPGAAKTAIGILTRETKPPIQRIGYLETAVSTVFAVLAGVGLGIAA